MPRPGPLPPVVPPVRTTTDFPRPSRSTDPRPPLRAPPRPRAGRPEQSYDIRDVIAEIVDDGEFLEVRRTGRRTSCARSPASTATRWHRGEPAAGAGRPWTSTRRRRRPGSFVRATPSTFRLVTLVDVPGFLPGRARSTAGSSATAPSSSTPIASIRPPRPGDPAQGVRRCLHRDGLEVLGADLSFAWPGNEIAVMGPEAAANIVFRKELQGERRSRCPPGSSCPRVFEAGYEPTGCGGKRIR